jgi:DNA invertase Pin-like site-specific DNA recombinase
MKTVVTVEIEWDQPDEKQWLCPENIEWALRQACKNTNFKVIEVDVVDDETFKREIGSRIDRLRLKQELRR